MVLNSYFTKTLYIDFPPTAALEQSLRAIWDAASQAAVLILPQIKLNSQFSSCTSFFSRPSASSIDKTWLLTSHTLIPGLIRLLIQCNISLLQQKDLLVSETMMPPDRENLASTLGGTGGWTAVQKPRIKWVEFISSKLPLLTVTCMDTGAWGLF